jgi:hypothetical protein
MSVEVKVAEPNVSVEKTMEEVMRAARSVGVRLLPVGALPI